MKHYLLTILASIVISNCIYSQDEKYPHNKTDLVLIDTNLARMRSRIDSSTFPNKNYKYNIKFKLHINGSDTTGLITVTKDGKPYETIQSNGIRFPLALDLNSYYLFKCTKPGYITKIVFFDTKVPIGKEKDDFEKFACIVNLFKEDGKTQETSKPVGGVKYSNECQCFDYEKDYK